MAIEPPTIQPAPANPALRATPELTILALVRMALGFAFIMLSIRLLGSESYGRYSTVLSVAIMFMFAYIGMQGVIVSRLVEARRLPLQDQNEALRALFCSGFVLTVPGAVLALLIGAAAMLLLPDTNDLHVTIAACVGMLIAQLATSLLDSFLEGMGRVRLAAILPTVAQMGASAVMVVCYVTGHRLSLAAYLALVLGMYLVETLVAVVITVARLGRYFRWRPDRGLAAELAREGFKLQLARLVTLTVDPINKGILNWFLGPGSVAVYDVVNKLAAGLQSVFSAYTRLFLQLSRSADLARRDSIQQAARFSWVLFLLCAGLVAHVMVVPAANWLKLNPISVEWCFVLCVFSHWWQVVATPMFMSLITFARYRFIFEAQVLLVVSSTIGSIIFVPLLGVAGLFTGYLLATMVNVARIEREFARSSDRYQPSLELARAVGGRLACAFVLLLAMPSALPFLDTSRKYWAFSALMTVASALLMAREPIWAAFFSGMRRRLVRNTLRGLPTKRR